MLLLRLNYNSCTLYQCKMKKNEGERFERKIFIVKIHYSWQ
jgi:hypothetical protein